MSRSSNRDYIQLNNQTYEIDIRLRNEEVDLRIPAGIIKDLVITDSIYSPFSHAILSINSTGNNLDNLVISKLDEVRNIPKDVFYAFNTYSRDTFQINITPRIDGLDPAIWGFNFNDDYFEGGAAAFTIYDEEEILDNRGQVKTKVFYLKSLSEQYLEEANKQWSTAYVVTSKHANKINLSHVTNDLRRAYTGDAIKHLIEDAAPWIQFAEDWDKGGTKVFYTSKPDCVIFDDIEYLLDRHISSISDDFCIFSEERDGKMSLRSMSEIYKKAYREDMGNLGDFFIDAFTTHCGTLDTASRADLTRTVPSKVYGFTEEETNRLEGLVNFSYLNIVLSHCF